MIDVSCFFKKGFENVIDYNNGGPSVNPKKVEDFDDKARIARVADTDTDNEFYKPLDFLLRDREKVRKLATKDVPEKISKMIALCNVIFENSPDTQTRLCASTEQIQSHATKLHKLSLELKYNNPIRQPNIASKLVTTKLDALATYRNEGARESKKDFKPADTTAASADQDEITKKSGIAFNKPEDSKTPLAINRLDLCMAAAAQLELARRGLILSHDELLVLHKRNYELENDPSSMKKPENYEKKYTDAFNSLDKIVNLLKKYYGVSEYEYEKDNDQFVKQSADPTFMHPESTLQKLQTDIEKNIKLIFTTLTETCLIGGNYKSLITNALLVKNGVELTRRLATVTEFLATTRENIYGVQKISLTTGTEIYNHLARYATFKPYAKLLLHTIKETSQFLETCEQKIIHPYDEPNPKIDDSYILEKRTLLKAVSHLINVYWEDYVCKNLSRLRLELDETELVKKLCTFTDPTNQIDIIQLDGIRSNYRYLWAAVFSSPSEIYVNYIEIAKDLCVNIKNMVAHLMNIVKNHADQTPFAFCNILHNNSKIHDAAKEYLPKTVFEKLESLGKRTSIDTSQTFLPKVWFDAANHIVQTLSTAIITKPQFMFSENRVFSLGPTFDVLLKGINTVYQKDAHLTKFRNNIYNCILYLNWSQLTLLKDGQRFRVPVDETLKLISFNDLKNQMDIIDFIGQYTSIKINTEKLQRLNTQQAITYSESMFRNQSNNATSHANFHKFDRFAQCLKDTSGNTVVLKSDLPIPSLNSDDGSLLQFIENIKVGESRRELTVATRAFIGAQKTPFYSLLLFDKDNKNVANVMKHAAAYMLKTFGSSAQIMMQSLSPLLTMNDNARQFFENIHQIPDDYFTNSGVIAEVSNLYKTIEVKHSISIYRIVMYLFSYVTAKNFELSRYLTTTEKILNKIGIFMKKSNTARTAPSHNFLYSADDPSLFLTFHSSDDSHVTHFSKDEAQSILNNQSQYDAKMTSLLKWCKFIYTNFFVPLYDEYMNQNANSNQIKSILTQLLTICDSNTDNGERAVKYNLENEKTNHRRSKPKVFETCLPYLGFTGSLCDKFLIELKPLLQG